MRAIHGRAAVIATAALVASVGLAPTTSRPADVPLRPLEALRVVDPSDGALEHARSVQATHEEAQRLWVAELQRQQDERQREQARASRSRSSHSRPSDEGAKGEPQAPVTGGGWSRAVASWYGPGLYGNGMACRGAGALTPETVGVAHRSLPCGTLVEFRVGERVARGRVVDRGPFVAGRMWDLTHGLCQQLAACRTGPVEWRLV